MDYYELNISIFIDSIINYKKNGNIIILVL
jgi:hypothetical protein